MPGGVSHFRPGLGLGGGALCLSQAQACFLTYVVSVTLGGLSTSSSLLWGRRLRRSGGLSWRLPHTGPTLARPAVGDTPSRSPWSRWARDRFARGVGRALLNPAKAVVFRVLRLTVLSDVAFY